MDLAMLKPLRGRVLIRPIFFEDAYDGPLVLPPRVTQQYPSSGFVVACGDLSEDIQPGDLVVFRPININPVEPEPYQPFTDSLFIIHEAEILARLEDWDAEDQH